MLKARAGDKLVLGLSARNIDLLMQKKPIHFELKELGMQGSVLIFYAPTEGDMVEELTRAGIRLDKGG